MSYCQELTDVERMELYVLIQDMANIEAKNMYEVLLSRTTAQLDEKKETYLTQFKGEWFSLLCLWMESKATNEFVRECLAAGHVIEQQGTC